MRRGLLAWAALALILVLALALRLREPLSSPIVGAEDPYLRMAHAWDVVQGKPMDWTYPPGFAFLLAPFALLGPDAFYQFARWAPPLLGVAETLGIYLLCRGRLSEPGALTAALVAALMPENVFRTNLLFPTALDLAVLPFLFLLVLRASEGSRPALWGAAGATSALLLIHPWVVALLAPVAFLFALWLAWREGGRARSVLLAATGAGAGLLLALNFLPGTWNPIPAFFDHAGPRFLELVRNPSSLFPLPVHVNLPRMLTVPILSMAGAGLVAALWRRSRLEVFVALWSLFILPFALVDWFGVWFIPHRSVAYLSLGVAVLAALPVDAVMRARHVPAPARAAGAVAAVALLLAGTVPAAAQVEPWYRLFDEDDVAAWDHLAEKEPEYVVTGSWQSASGLRARTGLDAVFNPTFFESREVRDAIVRDHPGLVVLVDGYTKEEQELPTDFLHGWRKVGEWGDVKLYEPW